MDASSACACLYGSRADVGVGVYSDICESVCPLNCVGVSNACFVFELDVCACVSFLPDGVVFAFAFAFVFVLVFPVYEFAYLRENE